MPMSSARRPGPVAARAAGVGAAEGVGDPTVAAADSASVARHAPGYSGTAGTAHASRRPSARGTRGRRRCRPRRSAAYGRPRRWGGASGCRHGRSRDRRATTRRRIEAPRDALLDPSRGAHVQSVDPQAGHEAPGGTSSSVPPPSRSTCSCRKPGTAAAARSSTAGHVSASMRRSTFCHVVLSTHARRTDQRSSPCSGRFTWIVSVLPSSSLPCHVTRLPPDHAVYYGDSQSTRPAVAVRPGDMIRPGCSLPCSSRGSDGRRRAEAITCRRPRSPPRPRLRMRRLLAEPGRCENRLPMSLLRECGVTRTAPRSRPFPWAGRTSPCPDRSDSLGGRQWLCPVEEDLDLVDHPGQRRHLQLHHLAPRDHEAGISPGGVLGGSFSSSVAVNGRFTLRRCT